MLLAAQAQLIDRKLKRIINRVTREFGATPTAYVQIGTYNLPVLHRGTNADISVIKQCFQDEQYDTKSISGYPNAEVDNYYNATLESGVSPLIVDCGANIGASALWFRARFPRAQITCIEPDPNNFELLQRNCFDSAFDLHQCGIGAEDGAGVLVDPGTGEWGYRTSQSGPGHPISIISLSKIKAEKPANAFKPFILKVDIEGAEQFLFDREAAFIDSFPIIMIELHDWMLQGQGTARGFFNFHLAGRRDFYCRSENVFSLKPEILSMALGQSETAAK